MAASPRTSEAGETQSVAVPGAMLRVEQRHGGGTALFVHGLGGDIHSWDPLWTALGPERAMARYDLRGFGKSTAGDGAPFDHVDDLAALLDALGVATCDLVGVSMGGGISLRFALDYPRRVRRLVLISPMIAAWEWSDDWMTHWQPILTAARGGDIDEARRLWWGHPTFDSIRDMPAGRIAEREVMDFPGAYWQRDDQRPVMPDVERLHALTAPTLLLSGNRDLDEFRLMADLIEASGQDVRRADLDAGHMLHLEDPLGCAALIAGHLDAS